MTIPAVVVITNCPDGRIVGRYGSLFDGTTPGPDLGAYQAGPLAVPSHGFYQQWTDRTNCPLTVKQTPAQIVAANRAFPYAAPDIGVPMLEISTPVFAGPMDSALIGKYMPAGGGGSDRCLITDHAAYFMRTGDAGRMFAQALAADSIPINYVDAATGKLPDLIAHPLTNSYANGINSFQYQPGFPSGPLDPTGVFYLPSGDWAPSGDHFPALVYTAFQASHDVGLLHNQQAIATFHFTNEPGESGLVGKAIIQCLQHRQLAWGLRDLFAAHVMTKDAEALGLDMTGLHPASYWKTLIDNQLAYRSPIMNDPRAQRFRLIDIDHIAHWGPWQVDYLISALAFGVLTGHSDWVPLYLWCLGNVIARTNNKSGWPAGFPAPYYVNGVLGGQDLSLPQFSWKEVFDNQLLPNTLVAIEPLTQAQYDALVANPTKLSSMQGSDYLGGCYAVLAQAAYLDKKGLAGVRAMYPDLDECLARVKGYIKEQYTTNYQIQMSERYSVASDVAALPPPVVVPPPNPIPPGGITLPTAAAGKVGQTIQLDLHGVTPPDADLSSLTYSAKPDGMVSLLKNATGVAVKLLKAGTVKVLGDVHGVDSGGNPATIETECDVTIAASVPLASSLGSLDQVS